MPKLLNIDAPLLTDGVLIFEYESLEDGLIEESIVVQDEQGAVVEGSVVPPIADDMVLTTAEPGLWLWRPAGALPTAKHFRVTTTDFSTGESRTLSFITAAGSESHAIDPEWFELELEAQTADRGMRTECCERDDGTTACFAPELVLEPIVRVAVEPSRSDPMLRQLLYRTTSNAAAASAGASAFVDRTRPAAPVLYSERKSEYCVQVEVLDAITSELTVLPERCEPDQPELFEQTTPKTTEQLAGSLGAMSCHRPPAGFEPAWCVVNHGQCFQRDALGCQHFDELCPEYEREPLPPDAGVAPDGGEPDAATDRGESNAGGCSAAGGSAHTAWWLAVVLASRWRRRAIRS